MGLYWALAPFRGKRLAPAKPSGRGLTRLRLLRPRGAKQAQGAEGRLGLRRRRSQCVYFIVGVWILKETFKNFASAEACFSISSKVKGSPI